MFTVSELASKNVNLGDPFNKAQRWRPEALHTYTVPPFYIYESAAKGAKAKREAKLQKVLAFVQSVKLFRYKNACTILSISSYNKLLMDIWGSPRNGCNGIKYMLEIGLISVDNTYYRFGTRDKNACMRYRYYKENEDLLLAYCKENNISYSAKTIINPTSAPILPAEKECKDIDLKSVRFSSRLTKLKMPSGWTKEEFEAYLLKVLYDNYPDLKYYQQKANDINQHYYQEHPEFQIKFEPSFTWEKNHVRRIGIRATNKMCSVDKNKRKEFNMEYGFDGAMDVKSSVPKLTIMLNTGTWLDNSIDVYELIFRELGETEPFTKPIRNTFKDLCVRTLFSGSDIDLGNQVYSSLTDIAREQHVSIAINRADIYSFAKRVKAATLKICGGKSYDSGIFYVESCIYMDVLADLLRMGLMAWQVYDCFYFDKVTIGGIATETVVADLIKKRVEDYKKAKGIGSRQE